MRFRYVPRIAHELVKVQSTTSARGVASKRHFTPAMGELFIDTLFEYSQGEYMLLDWIKFDAIWRHWVWFAQTFERTRMLWPAGMPHRRNVLAKLLHNDYGLNSKLQAQTYKRGDRVPMLDSLDPYDVAIEPEPRYNDNGNKIRQRRKTGVKNYVVVLGLKKRRNPILWPGAELPWYPEPWMDGFSMLGNPVRGEDPRWTILERLMLERDKAVKRGMKSHIAVKRMEKRLDEHIAYMHAMEKVFPPLETPALVLPALDRPEEPKPVTPLFIPPPIID